MTLAIQKPLKGRQLNWAHPLTRGLVGYWPFLEGSGSKVYNLANSGANVGTFSATPPAWVSGQFGRPCLNFDGTSANIDCGAAIDVSAVTAMTLSAWILSTAGAINKGVCGWYDSTQGIFIQSETSGDGFLILCGTGAQYGHIAFTTLGVWTHIAMVYDGSQASNATRLKFYANGIQQTLGFSGTIPASVATSGSFLIGDAGNLNRKWAGKLDDVHCYKRALNADEVVELYVRPFGMFQDNRAWRLYQSATTVHYRTLMGVGV